MFNRKEIDGCKCSPENSSTTKAGEHVPSHFSMSTILQYRYSKA